MGEIMAAAKQAAPKKRKKAATKQAAPKKRKKAADKETAKTHGTGGPRKRR